MAEKLKDFPWRELRPIVESWFGETDKNLQKKLINCSSNDRLFAKTAQYCFTVAREYAQSAFDLAEQGNHWPALAVIRPVMEYAIKLLWSCHDKSKLDDCHKRWEAETVRQRKVIAEGMRDMAEKASPVWSSRDEKVQFWMCEWKSYELPERFPRIDEIANVLKKADIAGAEGLYPSYRILCEGSHAILDLDQLNTPVAGGVVFKKRREMDWMTPSILCYACIALVAAIWKCCPSWHQYKLTQMFKPARTLVGNWAKNNVR